MHGYLCYYCFNLFLKLKIYGAVLSKMFLQDHIKYNSDHETATTSGHTSDDGEARVPMDQVQIIYLCHIHFQNVIKLAIACTSKWWALLHPIESFTSNQNPLLSLTQQWWCPSMTSCSEGVKDFVMTVHKP